MQNSENEMPTLHLTCYDGTRLEVPDDNKTMNDLGKFNEHGERFQWNAIYANSSLLSREARRFVTYRPPVTKRIILWFRRKWAEVWS